jgi:anti-sigma B factor antagonist
MLLPASGKQCSCGKRRPITTLLRPAASSIRQWHGRSGRSNVTPPSLDSALSTGDDRMRGAHGERHGEGSTGRRRTASHAGGDRPPVHADSTGDDMAAGQRRLDIEDVGDVTVARFVDKKILDENNIQVIGTQLYGLIEQDGRRKIVLDFSNVEYLSSAALGKLITLNNKVKSAKGKLRLCGIRPDIYEVFAITKLNTVFDIKPDRDQALSGF